MFRTLFTITMTITLTVLQSSTIRNHHTVTITIAIIIITTITIITILNLTTIKHNPGSIRNEALPVLNLYYNQAQSRQHPKRGTASTKLVLQSARLPLLSQKSRFRMGPDCPWPVKNLDSGWEPRCRELTCKPVRPNCPRSPERSRFLLGKQPKNTPGD